MNYNPSTIARIADIKNGIWVATSVFDNATYFDANSTTTGQYELFNVYGRIWVHALFIEAITDNGAGASQIAFNCTFTTPAIAVNAMCAKCASIAAMKRGTRINWLGGAVATNAVITDGDGLTVGAAVIPQIVGGAGFIGTIGMVTTDADAASGTSQAYIFYTQCADESAYVTANM